MVTAAAKRARWVAYLRVSTKTQLDGAGLDAQEAQIRAYARAEGAHLLRVHTDEGVSGTCGPPLRAGLVAAVTEVREHRADAICVARLDRLSRDLVGQESTVAELRRYRGELRSAEPAEWSLLADEGDHTRVMLRQFVGALSQWQAADIRQRLNVGRQRKAAAGGYAGGRPAYGFRAELRSLVIDAAEQAAIARMVALRRGGLSLRAIAAKLDAEGYRPKEGDGQWHPEQVRRALLRLDAL
jgi:site-specific DNA recombinase